MMRLSIEFTAIVRLPGGGLNIEAKCKAPSCRAISWNPSGDPDEVLMAAARHLHGHLKEYGELQEWIRGERTGVRTVRP